MVVMDFQRARNEEQRDQRRRAILEAATAMLGEMSVSSLSLNELSRRVGLAKSNVMRYFESREDVLLELLSARLHEWIQAIDLTRVEIGVAPLARTEAIARVLANSLADRPVLCDLISARAAVLERNISTDAVLRHKRSVNASVGILAVALQQCLPELDDNDIQQVISTTVLMTSGAWPEDQPTEAMLAAYEADPAIGEHRLSFRVFLRQVIATSLAGLIAQRSVAMRQ